MKKLLLVIDMQNDFIDGALGTPEAEAIVDKVVEKMKTYPTANIIATRDTHAPDYLHTQEGRNLPVKHCIQGTLGWQLHPAVAAALGEGQIMDKPTFGAGAGGAVYGHLRGLQRPAVEGGHAGSGDHRGRRLLRRRHAGDPSGGACDHGTVSDRNRKWVK